MIQILSKFYKFLLRKYYAYCIKHLVNKKCFFHAMFLFDKYRDIVQCPDSNQSYNQLIKENF